MARKVKRIFKSFVALLITAMMLLFAAPLSVMGDMSDGIDEDYLESANADTEPSGDYADYVDGGLDDDSQNYLESEMESEDDYESEAPVAEYSGDSDPDVQVTYSSDDPVASYSEDYNSEAQAAYFSEAAMTEYIGDFAYSIASGPPFTITIAVTDGTYEVEGNLNLDDIDADGERTIIISADPNFRIATVLVDGELAEGFAEELGAAEHGRLREFEVELTDINADIEIEAIMVGYHDITVDFSGNGTILHNGVSVASGDVFRVDAGANIAFDIRPNEDHGFSEIKIDDTDILVSDMLNVALDYITETLTLSSINYDYTINVTFAAEEAADYLDEIVKLDYDSALLIGGTYEEVDGVRRFNFINDQNAGLTFIADGGNLRVRLNRDISLIGDDSIGIKINESRQINVIQAHAETEGAWSNVNYVKTYTGDGLPIFVNIDRVSPIVALEDSTPDWAKDGGIVTVSGTVTDAGSFNGVSSGLRMVIWSTTQLVGNDAVLEAVEAVEDSSAPNTIGPVVINSDGTFSFDKEGEQDQTYFIYAVDNANNVSQERTVLIRIDETDPEITEFEFSVIEPNPLELVIRFLTFGIFFNDEIQVEVTANDPGNVSSGVYEISLSTDGIEISESPKSVGGGNSATFILTPEEFEDSVISASATDIAGNVSERVSPTDTDALSDRVVLTESPPTVQIVPTQPTHTDGYGGNWYEGDVEFTVTIGSEIAGIHEVLIKINEESITTDLDNISIDETFSERNAGVNELVFRVSTSQARDSSLPPHEGPNTIEVTVEDNAFNKITPSDESATETVYIDITNPEIVGFDIESADNGTLGRVLNFLTFGIFSNERVRITVTADDRGVDNDSATSLVETITLFANGVPIANSPMAATHNKEDGTFYAEFILPETAITGASVYLDAALSAVATDHVGNITGKDADNPDGQPIFPSEVNNNVINNRLIIETVLPTIDIAAPEDVYEDGNGNIWHPDDIELEITLEDIDSGIYLVEITINDEPILEDYNEKPIDADFFETQTHQEVFVLNTSQGIRAADGSVRLDVAIADNARNERADYRTFFIDDVAPTINQFEFTQTDNTPFQQLLNILTFGLFFNEEIRVAVSASDAAPTPGIASIRMYAHPSMGTPFLLNAQSSNLTDPAEATAVFSLPIGFRGNVGAVVTDNVGHQSAQIMASTENSNLQYAFIQVETIAPTIALEYADAVHIADGNVWHSGDIPITITASDTSDGTISNSGIRSVEIRINDTLIPSDINDVPINAEFFRSQTHEEVFVINTSQGTRAEDGSYRIDIIVIDNAGNAQTVQTTVFVDNSVPAIIEFAFVPEGIQEADGTDLGVETTDYGFYFTQNTTVTISAIDALPSSGIRSITYYTVCVVSGRSDEQTVNVTNDQISFTIPADFKGQIYARATDNVNHTPADFLNPNSIIIASSARHAAAGNISLVRPSTPFTDSEGLDLYADSINVEVSVGDSFAGLRRVEWTVISPQDPGNNQSGTINIANNGTLSGDTGGWSVASRDRNLVTQMTRTLTVSNNSNDIAVRVQITDRAGNTSESTIRFSIDRTTPTIEVTYDNETPDSTHTDYFNADRVATIVITERNFRADDVDIDITNTEGTMPAISAWSTSGAADETTHTATVTFTADGIYTFDISFSDNADNAAEPYDEDSFTIDQTDPIIEVAYDNNDAENTNHFDAGRTATITITERNFDPDRVNIIGTATDGGAPASFPTQGDWSSDGDEHTATIDFGADGLFNFEVEFMDMSGNTAESYSSESFFVDLTAPVLVETDDTAHNEVVSIHTASAIEDPARPLVFTDTNISHIMYTIIAYQYIEGEEHDGITVYEMGNVEIFANLRADGNTVGLPMELFAINGVYEIRANSFDLAGNDSGEIVHTFVVMRDIDMMAYVPEDVLSEFNGIHKQAVNFPDIPIHIFRIDDADFDISIGEIQLIVGDYEEEIVERASGVMEHILTIPNTFIASTFNEDDQIYELPINVSKNPIRTVARMVINNVPPSGMFDPTLGLRDGRGFYGVSSQEIRVINLSDGIDENTTTATINGENIAFVYDAALGTISFMLESSPAYGHPWAGHSIRVRLIDTAGNEFGLEEITNIFVGSWLMRYWIFVVIGSLLIVGTGVVTGVMLARKKKLKD